MPIFEACAPYLHIATSSSHFPLVLAVPANPGSLHTHAEVGQSDVLLLINSTSQSSLCGLLLAHIFRCSQKPLFSERKKTLIPFQLYRYSRTHFKYFVMTGCYKI